MELCLSFRSLSFALHKDYRSSNYSGDCCQHNRGLFVALIIVLRLELLTARNTTGVEICASILRGDGYKGVVGSY